MYCLCNLQGNCSARVHSSELPDFVGQIVSDGDGPEQKVTTSISDNSRAFLSRSPANFCTVIYCPSIGLTQSMSKAKPSAAYEGSVALKHRWFRQILARS